MIVLMRNAESSGNRDGSNMLVWDASGECRGESTLTDDGSAYAVHVGETFAERGIHPIVISSPMCRCTQTARLAFGDYIAAPDLRQRATADVDGSAAFLTAAESLFHQHRGGRPIVFVNHRPNIDALTMELIAIGEAVVGQIDEHGGIDVIGRIVIAPER